MVSTIGCVDTILRDKSTPLKMGWLGAYVLSSSKGVTSVTTPVLKSDLSMACEWDMYNYLSTMVNQVEFAVLRPIRINPKTVPANHSKNQSRAQWV